MGNLVKFRRRSGWTIVEVLVVLGITALVLSIVVPSLGSARGSGLHSKTTSNVRQMAIGLQMYADSNRDCPPVFGSPVWPSSSPWRFEFGNAGEGNWFEHSYLYAYEILALLGDRGVARSAGNPDPENLMTYKGVAVCRTDFFLTNALYASPGFFNWDTQSGLAQFGVQHLTSIAYPSSKGLLWPYQVFFYPKYGRVLSCCSVDLAAPIAFADHSVSDHIMRRMRPGIFNLYAGDGAVGSLDPRTLSGTPVANTVNGILGRDLQ
jgi:type II secretory pathway pseudopilin PulG